MNTLTSFHPVIQRWWRDHIGADPTPAQARGWESIRSGRDTLIAAPTGSGKTLAAFLHSIDDLLEEGLEKGALPDEVRVIYVSPLKALSADIHRNLAQPRSEILRLTEEMGLPPVRITAATRSGDTPQSERAAMLRTPPHILVTTPESLYLLLTAERPRAMLKNVRTVIVDEIHAVIETRRGAHLALSLERLDHVAGRRLQRIGLSATQRPIEKVAEFLTGGGGEPAAIIDEGHTREIDLAVEMTASPLEAVMSAEVWGEVYDRLAELAREHKTTIVFVNTRRLAERAARQLSERLGEELVTAHHGSLSKEKRLDAEERLKTGQLRILVATASLELGIDIGHVDLVCQLGSPHRIATLLQRVGRSGHTVKGKPKGRIFPLSRDDLIECAALLRAWRAGELDRIIIPPQPTDVLAQQIVAEAAADEWAEDALYDLVRRAYPYRDLARDSFDDIVTMLARGISTHRGRRGALIHHDAVNGRIRGRKGARLLAITSGGAIPDVADYRVIMDPDGTFVGTLNEDFAIESMAGDIFQLGNTSWRILKVEPGVVRVADAHGEPPSIPFWLGEAPARSDELSEAVASLRADVEARLRSVASERPFVVPSERQPLPVIPSEVEGSAPGPRANPTITSASSDGASVGGGSADPSTSLGMTGGDSLGMTGGASLGTRRLVASVLGADAMTYLQVELGLPGSAAVQIIMYLAETRRLLGVVPTQDTLVLERFFDEGGGMQLVLHAPFGARVNRAWGLALRKKFCQNFNFELQAAATDEGVLLSLGPQHSFPLEEVYRYLNPATLRDTLIQAMLDSPIFQTRWRWVAMLALTIPRTRNGKRTPPQIQRMAAEDLLSSVFPDATACLEHVVGAREIPSHPLVDQTIKDCLEEAMDLPQLEAILRRMLAGELTLVARDTTEPSPLASEIVNARVYQFLDDAPLEERRTQAVYTRRSTEPSSSNDLAALDASAIERVRGEAWPSADDADELHDALLTSGFLLETEALSRGEESWPALFQKLVDDRRAARAKFGRKTYWIAAERLPELRAALESGVAAVGAAGLPAVGVPGVPPGPIAGVAPGVIPGVTPGVIPSITLVIPSEVEGSAPGPHAQGPLEVEREPAIVRGSRTDWTSEEAMVELLRSRLDVSGPARVSEIAGWVRENGITSPDQLSIDTALLAIEGEGRILRGYFTPGGDELEWCDRRLLARIHRYTLDRLRAEIKPVSARDFLRFLFRWQRLEPGYRTEGAEGLAAVIDQMGGFEAAAAAWEADLLPTRVSGYDATLLDSLCLSGRVVWGHLGLRNNGRSAEQGGGRPSTPVRATPITLCTRESLATWLVREEGEEPQRPSSGAQLVFETLQNKGASFFHDIVSASGMLPTQVEIALAELVSAGAVTADSFTGLRALLVPEQKRGSLSGERRTRRGTPSIHTVANAGRWSLLRAPATDDTLEQRARALLKRYGVVFRRLLARESGAPSWRDLVMVYRRMEARGEIRGGRFVAGVAGEQFALPDAIGLLRAVRKEPLAGTNFVISAADPLNLVGVITPELERVTASHRNRILFRDGSAVAAMEGGQVRLLEGHAGESEEDLRRLLVHGPVAPELRPYLKAPRQRRPRARKPQGQEI